MKCMPSCCYGAGWRMLKPWRRWRMNLPCSRTMNIKAITMKSPVSFITIVISAIVVALLATACNKHDAEGKPDDVDYYTCTMHPSVRSQDPKGKCPICSMDLVPVMKKVASSGKPDDVDYYTCTMHPSVKSQDPKAKCPICSMDLVPVMKRGAAGMTTNTAALMSGEEKPSEFTVPVERQQQIGVTFATIEKRPFIHTVRAVGMVTYDKERHWDYVARVEGYVQKLFVFSRGELVQKNEPLLTI